MAQDHLIAAKNIMIAASEVEKLEGIPSSVGKLFYLAHSMPLTPVQKSMFKDMIIREDDELLALVDSHQVGSLQVEIMAVLNRLIEEPPSVDSKRSRNRPKPPSIVIPKRNIQKLPGHPNRV